MSSTATQMAHLLEGIARNTMTQLEGMTPEDLNRKLSLPESNTLFALATHLVGAGEFWVLVLVGQREIPRSRSAEFGATGGREELLARYQRWIQDIHEVLHSFPEERLGEPAEPPASYHVTTKRERTDKRDALLHALEHSALHLGHIQLTRQFLGYPAPISQE